MEFIPPPGTAMHNPPQFSPRHPPHHMQQNGSILSGNSPHLHIPFNNHHHHNPLPPHNGPSVVDLNNNAMHMYNQPSLLLATPLSPGQQYPTLPAPQIHSSPSSETGPAESESTTPTSGSCSGESSSNSESNQNLATIPPFYNGGSHQQHQVQQQQFYHHQNGMIATQLAEDLQTKINPLASNQYVSLFIVWWWKRTGTNPMVEEKQFFNPYFKCVVLRLVISVFVLVLYKCLPTFLIIYT